MPRESDMPHLSVDENLAPDQQLQSSQYQGMRIATATYAAPSMPRAFPDYDPTMPPPPVPFRRSSMQDAANDIMRATYPPALPLPTAPPVERAQSPRFFSPIRRRHGGKGKGRALDIYVPPPPAGEVVGRCRWNTQFGYVCDLCSRIIPNPSLHQAGANGERCTDFNFGQPPLLSDVEADVMRDPEAAIRQANLWRANQQMQREQQQMQLQQHQQMRDVQQNQQWISQWQGQSQGFPSMAHPQAVGTSRPSMGFGRASASASRPSFTTASQIQQWAGEASQPQASTSGSQPEQAPP